MQGIDAGAAAARAAYELVMTQEALDRFPSSGGWTAGVDASVTAATGGVDGNVDPHTIRSPAPGHTLSNGGLRAVSIDVPGLGSGRPTTLLARVPVRWRTKMTANIAGMASFFAAYFWVLANPFYAVHAMPLTALDRWIVYEPMAIVPYASLWVYVCLPLALLVEQREFRSYGLAAGVIAAGGLVLFILWPTTTPVDSAWLAQSGTLLIGSIDGAGNACPSLHVAFAVFTGIWLHRLIGESAGGRPLLIANWIWCAVIAYSTIAMRQHVVVDVLAGALWGGSIATINMVWLQRGRR